MNTRVAAKSDVNAIKDMWENSRGGGAFTQWFFDKVFYSANAVIAEENGAPLACACTIPYTIKINGNDIEASYIGGIAANPENRSTEVMNVLAADTLGFIAGKNIPIAFTVPDNYKFFERYGFSLCYDYKQYDITPDDLPSYGINGTIVRPSAINKDIIDILNGIYEKFTLGKNGYTIRTEENWKLIFDDFYKNFDGKCVIYKNQRDEFLGYMLYIIRDNKMGVYELAYSKREGYEGLIGFIKAHEGIINKVSVKTPSDDLLYLTFCDNRTAVASYPFAAARITDVREILRLYKDLMPQNLRIQVIDRVMEENNHTYTFAEGDVIIIETEANVATDIGTLTQLVLGYLSVDEAYALNLVKGDASLLKQIFKKQTTYINMLSV